MPSIPPLTCRWYKGNLHTHSTHNRVTVLEQDGARPLIPGVEITTRREATKVEYHLITIREDVSSPHAATLQFLRQQHILQELLQL